MPWRPEYPGEIPTLGFEVLQWIEDTLVAPDKPDYQPFLPTMEQAQFVLNFYQLDPKTGKRMIRRGLLSRPRGWGKSPFVAALACAEALGPVLFDGWDANGRPVGKPWATVRTPIVQVAAVSEDQTRNTWTPLQEMLEYNADDLGIEILTGMINLPRGQIRPIAAAARTIKGNKPVFVVMDQTEEWVSSNSGPKLAETIRVNAAKVGGTTIETPNAYIPGEQSVAELSAQYAQDLANGKGFDPGFLYDHREAPSDTDLSDKKSLIAGLAYTYGDSADVNGGWVDLDRLSREVMDPATDPQVARNNYLNQITHAADSWLSQPELRAVNATLFAEMGKAEVVPLAPGDTVTLGFDGSRGRTRGKADATALVGCRVSDGHLFDVGVWEPPEGPSGDDWKVPELLVESAVQDAFSRYNVVGFYADPSMWDGHVARWGAMYGKKLKVSASRDNPVAFNTRSFSNVVAGFEQLHAAIVNEEISYNGSLVLTRHFLNARRQSVRSGVVLRKPNDDYLAKIDAAYASMLAFSCRLAAVGKGIGARRNRAPKRIY